MGKITSPQQKLFSIETQIFPSLQDRLWSSWAHLFRLKVLPVLFRNGEQFSRVPEPMQQWHTCEPEGWSGLDPFEQKVKPEELAQFLHEVIILSE